MQAGSLVPVLDWLGLLGYGHGLHEVAVVIGKVEASPPRWVLISLLVCAFGWLP
jgi:hypothetical protein